MTSTMCQKKSETLKIYVTCLKPYLINERIRFLTVSLTLILAKRLLYPILSCVEAAQMRTEKTIWK